MSNQILPGPHRIINDNCRKINHACLLTLPLLSLTTKLIELVSITNKLFFMQNNFLKPFLKYFLLLLCSLQGLALSAVSQSSGTGAPFVKGSKSLGLSAGFGIGYNYISG